MPHPRFQPGFRLSAFDVIVLVIGTIASAGAAVMDRMLGVAIAFVVLHFFLFCNVLRLPRSLELIWAGVFAALAAGAMTMNVPSWPVAFAVSVALTAMVAIIAMRRPSYHGVGWRRLNPRLPEWWQSTAAGGSCAPPDAADGAEG
jgi:hypothetical protein